ncbi:3-hydroxyacyl-CoA dehydrogenase NAD-binding domain-containing protein [Streptomyces lichenis]|uniref:3-hydroxyacyl-CoA dehydrogenase NAD-binding domain-containing protein n=1 Tax=Streptomyces lichenis TaxID=2306967 RepID=A0ABT0IB05_9ACTN|nr:3-hydroxyacyl-CoA dehydrogenase NAD-binding domain-containing protein [Streptomyces lichenis]MCK8678494.1 3-hydroxyacyl-CoA dehydrogenase NAD-binding domain-containing protein [Streptomyces lichenis]
MNHHSTAHAHDTITTVAVVGAGTVGLGWAALFAAHGHAVRLTDPRPDLAETLDEAMPLLAASLHTTARALRARVEISADLAEAVRDADLVQENGPERLELKQELFADIARHAPGHAVLASSSSGIVPSAIARRLPDEAAARMLIAHPFNPPQVVPLVELVPGTRTSERTVARAAGFYRSLERVPVRLRKEIEGFVANRLQGVVLREAFRLVADGVVTAEELDTIMKTSLGGRWAVVGPLESYHLGGGPGGIRHMVEHLGKGLEQADGTPAIDEAALARVIEQTESAYGTGPAAYRARAERRDRKQLAVNAAVAD